MSTANITTYRFVENGGYDCMTDAFHVENLGKLIVQVDLADFGQEPCAAASWKTRREAEDIARLIAAAPAMLEALQALVGCVSSAPRFLDPAGMPEVKAMRVEALALGEAALALAEDEEYAS